ncbi:MAG: ribbon-helix-helix domain-containing protein [Candidatus Methanoperedens sp.]|nr:ribbon-helix-helix domain-containing protein [Candidatus Methanoperedens sp.]
MEQVRRKITISVTLSPNLVNQIDEVVETKDFAGPSDVISQALSEFFARYYDRKKSHAQCTHEIEDDIDIENNFKKLKFDNKPARAIEEALSV